jgi:hypothetical protein
MQKFFAAGRQAPDLATMLVFTKRQPLPPSASRQKFLASP